MMKPGETPKFELGRDFVQCTVHCTKISPEYEFGGHSPPGAYPQQCGDGLERWENQRRLSS